MSTCLNFTEDEDSIDNTIRPIRPPDLSLLNVTGVDIIIHIDNRIHLTQQTLMALRNGAIDYMHSLFSPVEICCFYDNSMWWNVAYTYSRLGFIPTDFQIWKDKMFLHYYPPLEMYMILPVSFSESTSKKKDEKDLKTSYTITDNSSTSTASI